MSPGRPSAARSLWTADADGGSAPPPGCAAARSREGRHASLLEPSELVMANDMPLPSLSVGNTPDIPPSPFAGVLFIAVVILRSHKCTARWFLRALDRTLRLRKCLDRAPSSRCRPRSGSASIGLYRLLRRCRCAPFPESARTGAGHSRSASHARTSQACPSAAACSSVDEIPAGISRLWHCAPVASSVRVWQLGAGYPLRVRHIVGDRALTLRSFARTNVMPRVRDF